MRGWLPLLALTLTLAAGALPAAAETPSGVWVAVYYPGLGYVWQWRSNADTDEDKTEDGSTLPPRADVTEAGVTVVRGGNAKPPTVEDAADGVTVTRGQRTRQ